MSFLFFSFGKSFFRKTVFLIIIALALLLGQEKLFPQTRPDPWGEETWGKDPLGINRRVLDYQFDRADRELTPGRWMEEARQGIMTAMAVWAEYLNPGAYAEFVEWSEQELENRFTRWLLERFFGAGIEVQTGAIFRETGEADKYLLYFTGQDGNILYDPGTGDPKIIRPGDEGHDFSEDLSAWKQRTQDAADREVQSYQMGIKEKYPELLMYILPGREEEFERKLTVAENGAAVSLMREFEAILVREERYFTAQRLGDVWSLRKKSEDQSADAIGSKLIEEARQICADGIAAIETKMEAARVDGGDLVLAGTQWLEEYREQFNRGLKAWESAEERFFLRRLEWEQSAEKTFYEGMETWNAVFKRFEEERSNWEEKARVLFLEGEQFFAQASETLVKAIAEARAEYGNGSGIRIEAASERAGALANMYVLSGSAAEEARKNIDFWIGRYREIQSGTAIPSETAALDAWIDNELLLWTEADQSLERLILNEIRNWSVLYRGYTAKADESRERLMIELNSATGAWNNPEQGDIFYPDSYEIERMRAEGELEYWKNRTALAEAVAAYAEALDAGRVTAAESFAAWEKAKAAYDEDAALYGMASDSLKSAGAGISFARDTLAASAEKMRAADASLEMLRQNYQSLASMLGSRGSGFIAEDLAWLNLELAAEQELLGSAGDTSPWGKFLASVRELENRQLEEMRKAILRQLIAGDGENLESLADLARKTENGVLSGSDPLFGFAETLQGQGKINVEQYDLLLYVFNESSQSLAENQLDLRLAALSLLIENGGGTEWYFSVRKSDGEERADFVIPNLEVQLLCDWEMDSFELLRARADMELGALDFLDGKQDEELSGILASLYTGDDMKRLEDREVLEQILDMLHFFLTDRTETYTPGDFNNFLAEVSEGNERMLFFLSGNSLISPMYGREITEAFLKDYVSREEFSRGLYSIFTGFGDLCPVLALENTERGFLQLERLWETLGVETGSSVFPGTGAIINVLTALIGEEGEALPDQMPAGIPGIPQLLFILDEIFYSLPTEAGFIFNMWKENLTDYNAAPSADILARAETHSALLDSVLIHLKNEGPTAGTSNFGIDAARYLAEPFLEWDEDLFLPLAILVYDDYESALEELQGHYSREKYLREEIGRLSILAEMARQGLAAAESEMEEASSAIALAVEACERAAVEYQDAADNFRQAGAIYDSMYEKAEEAFKNLEDSRRAFEIQDAVRLWAESAYLDSRRPADELRYCLEKEERARGALGMLESLAHDSNSTYSREYDDALKLYQENLSLYILSLDALYKLDRAIDAEQEKNDSAYMTYQKQLALLGKSFFKGDDYVSPEDKALWDIKDMLTIEDGFLVFARDSDYVLSGSDAERSEMLNEYFTPNKRIGDEPNLVSSFEIAMRELSGRLLADAESFNKYLQLGLARDYLVREILNNNPGLGGTEDWYRIAEYIRKGNNLGSMLLKGPKQIRIYEVAEDAAKGAANEQKKAWNSLDDNTKKDLEFYTILCLLDGGGVNADYFSRVSEYLEYDYTYAFADFFYKEVIHLGQMFRFGSSYTDSKKITKATKDNLAVVRNSLKDKVNQGFYGLSETLMTLNKNLVTYKESSDRLSVLKGGWGQIVSWDDIETALGSAKDFNEDISPLKELWDRLKGEPGFDVNSVPAALKLLMEAYKGLTEDNFLNLSRIWETAEGERTVFEKAYRELYGAYMAGGTTMTNLEAAALLSFPRNVPSAKEHIENIGNVLMESLGKLSEWGLSGIAESALLAGTYTELIAGAWEGKYAAELSIRMNEWELQQRDIQEKLVRWRESAALILEQGRIAWKEGDEKLREACNMWVKAFGEEYGRINDGWTAAYLEGLQDKETWAAAALQAAEHASSAAVLALLGSGAEAGARAMDTRDPSGFMYLPDMREGEKILAELLDKSGTGYLTAAFGSISASPETFATVVRTGLSGGGIWNSGAAVTEASALARTVREEFETRESQKMAYSVMNTAREAYTLLEGNLRLANGEFRKKIDETFVVGGQWRRNGTWYIKEVIVHSTLFNSVITDHVEVEGYRDFILPQTQLSLRLDGEPLQNLNTFQTEALIDSIYSEIVELNKKIFGSAEEDIEGEFPVYIGYSPKVKDKANVERGQNEIFDDQGSGEAGRLLRDFYYWMMKEQLGLATVAMAPWEKPLWDSRDSVIKAPSMKTTVNVAIQTGILIAGAVGAPFTAGASVVGSIVLRSLVASAGDFAFSLLDVTEGYKSWGEAGFDFGKSLLMNTVSTAAGSLLYGVNGASSSFFKSGGVTGLFTDKAFGSIGGLALRTTATGINALTTGTINSLLGSVTYSNDNGFGFSKDAFMQGVKNSGINSLSSMTGNLTSGILNMGLTGFVGDLFGNGQKLNGLVGGLASQGVDYAFGNDFTLNVLNAGILFDKKLNVNAGLVELHLGRNGVSFELGNGGADASIGTMISAVKGFETWKVNTELFFSEREAAAEYTTRLRTLYSMGGEDRNEYEKVLAGKTVYEERRDIQWTQSVYDETTGIKTVYLGSDALNDTSPFGLNVIFSHEAHRDGITGTDEEQIAERDRAVLGHAETALEIIKIYGAGSLGTWMGYEAISYALAMGSGDMGSLQSILDSYDSSADYWKLVKNENNLWAWFDDKSADFDITDLLKDKDYQRRYDVEGGEKKKLMDAMVASGIQDGKAYGIISAGRMTEEIAIALGYVSTPLKYVSGSYYTDSLRTTTLGGLTPTLAINPLISDTLDKIAFNAMHTTTINDKYGRPITLFNMDSANSAAREIPGQHDDSIANIPFMDTQGCNFMDIIALPQILTRQTLGDQQITELWNQAIKSNIMEMNGFVNDRNALANLAMQKMGISNFGIDLSGTKPNNAALVGYRVKVPTSTGGEHFVLTGTNKSLVYNPGNSFTSNQNLWKGTVEVYVYAK